MTRILSFGDSITLGEADEIHGGWADRLKRHYFKRCVKLPYQLIKFYNLGIGGETTDGLRQRFAVEYKARAINGQQNIVILAYGANDIVIHKQKNIVPKKYFKTNLESAIHAAKEKSAIIILLSLLPIADKSDGVVNQHRNLRYAEDIVLYNEVLQQLAIENDCQFIDLYSLFSPQKTNLISADGIHPNSFGHELIYHQLKTVLDSYVNSNPGESVN